uniref:DUF11 domain-containing protein n=1 Tax=Candidatus Methanogaster sp. ANME-2c ERB4 TaxID=2759911 RepID=A0A7G9Y1L1_9EURY|nr:hypothetical protein FJLPHLKL_00004 [Methanosarcinales archaeon ANME-2c ERB4]
MSRVIGLILVAIMLTGGVGAHTYDPEEAYKWTVCDSEEEEVEWGDTIDAFSEGANETYTIEVVDFHVQTSKIDLDEIARIKGDVYECGDCSKAEYVNKIEYAAKTVNLRIYKNQTLVGSFPFRANESNLKDDTGFSTKASSWDTTGMIWNHNNDFYVAVSKITCDFAKEDCFCTDPENKKATIRYLTRKPAVFEVEVKTLLPGGEKAEEMSEFRSNARFMAEITIKNKQMTAHHVDATVSIKPAEMINGEYPEECAVEKIYRGKHDDDDRKWIANGFPMDVRTLGIESSSADVFMHCCGGTPYTVHFKTPSIPQRTKYEIQINITYEDLKEKPYEFTDNSTIIEILPVVEVKKAIGTEDYAVVASEAVEAYTGETTCTIYTDYDPYIFFTVINWGDYTIPSLTLRDSPVDTWHKPATTDFNVWKCALPADMLKVPDMESDLWNWDFSLEPGEVMTCAYPVSLLKPGTYKLGSATVNWTEDGYNYSMVSYPQPVEVHGPYIEVTKTIDPALVTQNNTTTVTVIIKNTGDRPASLTIMDQLPMESVLVHKPVSRGMVTDEGNGTFFLKRVIKAGEVETFDYTIDPNRTVMLPPAVVEFVDITTYEGISISDMPILTVNGTKAIGAAADVLAEAEAKAAAEAMNASGSGSGVAAAEVAETIETPVRTEPGFTGVFAVLACLAAVLIGRRRK